MSFYVAALERQLAAWTRRAEIPIYCGSVDTWHEYFDANFQRLSELTNRLKRNVDPRSIAELDLFIDRYRHVFPPSRFQGHVFFDPEVLLTSGEQQEAIIYKSFIAKGVPYKFPDNADVNEMHLFWRKGGLTFVPELVRQRLAGRDVLDGGAYCGETSLVFTEFDPKSVHAFEPFPANISLLEETIELNGLSALIHAVPMALSDSDGELDLIRYRGATSGKVVQILPRGEKIPDNQEKAGTVTVTTIDHYVTEHRLNPGLIKLDVEGAELSVVKGALDTIERFRPLLVISLYHRPEDFFEIRPLIESRVDGYQFIFRYLSPVSPSNEFMLIGYPTELDQKAI